MFHRHAIERLNVNLSDWVTAMFFLLQTLQVFGSHNGRLFILRSKYGPNFWIVLFPFRLYLLLALRKLALITLFFAWTCYVRKQNTSLDLQTEALRFPLCFVQTCSKTRSRRSNLKSHFTSVQVLISPLSFLQIWISFSFCCMFLSLCSRQAFHGNVLPAGMHLAPASLVWLQLWTPIPGCGQLSRLLSLPVHSRSSRYIGPLPLPKDPPGVAAMTPGEPSCRQATRASLISQ